MLSRGWMVIRFLDMMSLAFAWVISICWQRARSIRSRSVIMPVQCLFFVTSTLPIL